MKRIVPFGACILTLSLAGVLFVEAQPRQGTMGGARVEQVLAFLAFDEEVNVSDEQLLKLRKALKEVYVKQQGMMEEMQQMRREGGGDFQKLLEEMTALSEEMNEKISAVLEDEQVKRLEEYMQQLQSRRGGFQGGRSPEGAGGRRRF